MTWVRGEAAGRLETAAALEDMATLMAQYGPRVSRFLLFSLNDADAAETLTQECFLRAYRSRGQFRGECNLSTWLIRIAHNLVRDHTGSEKFRFWRRVSRQAIDAADLACRLAGAAPTAEALMLTQERLQCVWTAARKLSSHQRSIFLLRFVEGLDIEEIAQATNMKAGTVKTHLHRALTAVRKQAAAEGLLNAARGVAPEGAGKEKR